MIGLLVANLLKGDPANFSDGLLRECYGQCAYCIECRFYLPQRLQVQVVAKTFLHMLAKNSPFSMPRVIYITSGKRVASGLRRQEGKFQPAQVEFHPLFNLSVELKTGFREGCELISVGAMAVAGFDNYLAIDLASTQIKNELGRAVASGCPGVYLYGGNTASDIAQRLRLVQVICKGRLSTLFEELESERRYRAMFNECEDEWPDSSLSCAYLDCYGWGILSRECLNERVSTLGRQVFGTMRK